jgi:hypothetical protein
MFDTLHLYLDRERAGGVDLLAHIPHLLEGLTEAQRDGRPFATGNLGNLRVSLGYRGVSVKGSLSKYHLGDNMQTLTRQDTQRGIERLSDELGLPMRESALSRIDFGQNLLMRHEPRLYYPYLGESRYYQRYTASDSLNYKNGRRFKIFYDKRLESKLRGYPIPEVWLDQNALRYESRYLGRINQNLHQADITAQTLYDERFYIGMVRRYFEEYEAIQKVLPDPIDYSAMKSPKDFWKQIAILQLQEWGQPKALGIVDELKARGAFPSPEYYSRLKKDIKDAMGGTEADISQSLIAELDHKVKALKRFYR